MMIEVLAAGEPGPALPHLSEIVVGFIGFSVLIWVLSKYAWPLLVKSHEGDKERIRSGIERADADQEQARAELERNRQKLAGVDNEAARIRDDARADAERIKESMARRTEEEAERVRAQGRQSLDASRSRTVSELRADVGAQSVELARRIVSASLADEPRKGESVDRFLSELEGMGGGSANGSSGPSSAGAAREGTAGAATGSGTPSGSAVKHTSVKPGPSNGEGR